MEHSDLKERYRSIERSSNGRGYTFMTEEEFDALTPAEQKAELSRALAGTGLSGTGTEPVHKPLYIRTYKEHTSALIIATAVSMILGFGVLIAGLCLNDKDEALGNLLAVIGLVGVIGGPAVCCFLETLGHDRTLKKMRSDPKFAGILGKERPEDLADANFSGDTPPAKVLWTGGGGITLAAASLVALSIFHGTVLGILFGALFFTGFSLLSVSLKLNKRRDAALMMNFPALLGLFVMILNLTAVLNGVINPGSIAACSIIYLLMIALMPLIYNVIKKVRCTDTVRAKCISVKESTPSRDRDMRFTPVWSYRYNGRDCLHEDLSTTEYIKRGDEKELKINPYDPHDVYNVKLPHSCLFVMLFCVFAAAFAFMATAGFAAV